MEIIYQGKIENVECVDEFGFDKIELLLEAMDLSTEYDDEGVGRYVLNRQMHDRLLEYVDDFTRLCRLKGTKAFKELSPEDKNDFLDMEHCEGLSQEVLVSSQLVWLRLHGIT